MSLMQAPVFAQSWKTVFCRSSNFLKLFFFENLGQAAPDDAYFTLQSHFWAELQPFENFKNGPKKGRFSALVTSKPRHGQGWDLRQKLSAPKWPPMMVLSGNAIKKFWVRDTLVDWQWPALLNPLHCPYVCTVVKIKDTTATKHWQARL